MVEGARLESVYTGNRIASSNLAVSALYPPYRQSCQQFDAVRPPGQYIC